ncbi:MAG TPA: hypothetical protein VNN79_14365, partial [Actinomycetota bacterium]|nr:hypothetical protein [Actinomycetota bacterium]
LAVATEAALSVGDMDGAARRLGAVEAMPPGHVAPALRAQWSRLSALLAAARSDDGRVEAGFKAGAGLFRELGMRYWLAVTLLQHGEWLSARDRREEATDFLAEAGELFERLGATPWIERVRAAQPAGAAADAERELSGPPEPEGEPSPVPS